MMVGVIQPRGWVSDDDKALLREALSAREDAETALRDAIRTASENGASVRELATFLGKSTNTIQRWKSEP